MYCPTCDTRIIWRDDDYLRCPHCGLWCPAYMGDSDTNVIIGDWSEEELQKLDKAMEKYCDTDFVFYKGRNLWSSWRKDQSNVRVVVGRTLERLIGML